MTLRDATSDDVPVIAELIGALAEYEHLADQVVGTVDDLRAALFGPDPVARVTLAIDDGGGPGAIAGAGDGAGATVVGFALWWRTFSTFLARPGIWLEDLFVRPEHRGRGHGLALLQDLRRRTDGRVEWNVLDWNEPSIRFYRALGARPLEGWTQYRWLPGPPPSAG